MRCRRVSSLHGQACLTFLMEACIPSMPYFFFSSQKNSGSKGFNLVFLIKVEMLWWVFRKQRSDLFLRFRVWIQSWSWTDDNGPVGACMGSLRLSLEWWWKGTSFLQHMVLLSLWGSGLVWSGRLTEETMRNQRMWWNLKKYWCWIIWVFSIFLSKGHGTSNSSHQQQSDPRADVRVSRIHIWEKCLPDKEWISIKAIFVS